MLYTFGRVGPVTAMNVEDYFVSGRRPMFRLHEKGGKNHLVPAHHNAQEYVEEYLEAAGVRDGPKAPLFQSADPARRTLTGRRLLTRNALAMVKRRARAAGLPETTRCHTMRATAITNYLQNGGPRRTPGPWRPMSRRRPPGCTITPGTTLPWTRLSGSGFDRGILPGTSKPL